MERELHDRDRVGLQDQVLLEEFQSEDAFVENLRKRFQEDLIYTYIGPVLISINPYKDLGIYTEQDVQEYRGKHFFETPPHVFAVSDNAYRALIEENRGQCILISGESGSGKTEASKKVLQHIAAASGHTASVESVKDRLLCSNPILEGFGNARTNFNNNSSRFGKYMDVQFDFRGVPDGGNIFNYLLEKSRVVHQNQGERNFHIFYQLLAGAEDAVLEELELTRDPSAYGYLTNGVVEARNDRALDDAANFKVTQDALKVIGVPEIEHREILSIVAGILHLGNVAFVENEHGHAIIHEPEESLANITQLLNCDVVKLQKALTHRTIDARGDVITSPLNREMALYARDALAKAVYDRLFSWLVERINRSLHSSGAPPAHKHNVLGILDIYGFELLSGPTGVAGYAAGFEQFCINFCNEKLQSLFIELTLKQEQDEYIREGIEWKPVDYFDNKVICELIEGRHVGIIALLDEECLRPGDATDLTFLDKMNDRLANHKHYICHSRASIQIQKLMDRHEFKLRHYAGDVQYSVRGFLDKNNDLLFRDAKEAMSLAGNSVVQRLFPHTEVVSKKRPLTAATQFQQSLTELMQNLAVKEPSYIRCIKPNSTLTSNNFDQPLIRHQIKYLGLMENLRVRRAGFAYRRTYDTFLQRYKCLSKQTWPHWHGEPKEGVKVLVNDLGYEADDFRMGYTKIFIRLPGILFRTEDAFQHKKHELASLIQARWKGRRQRAEYMKIRAAIIVFQKYTRRFLAIQALVRRKAAVERIRYFIKGYITRNEAPNECNGVFIEMVKRQWLVNLSKSLPTSFMLHNWPKSAAHCEIASEQLRQMHKLLLARKYRKSLSEDRRRQLEMKVVAETHFKGKKKCYIPSVPVLFVGSRLQDNMQYKGHIETFVKTPAFNNEKLMYATFCVKYDRRGYKPRDRLMVLSDQNVYVFDAKTLKQKHRWPLSKIECCVTSERDGLLLIRSPTELTKEKGDLILDIPHIIECSIWLITAARREDVVKIVPTGSLTHQMSQGKAGTIEIQTGPKPGISKAKSGNLLVIAAQ